MDQKRTISSEPLVSILMNCYNGERYLKEAIDSVLCQTYQNWELIFWDNQSTDHSKEIFHSYDDQRLKYFLAPEHTDLGGARARAFRHLVGEFVAVLDADDVWMPKKLEKQIPLFDDPEVGIVISDALFFNDRTEKALYGGRYPPTGWVFEKLLAKYFVSLTTLIFRLSNALDLSRAFDPDFSFIADFDLVVRLSRISKLVIYPEILAKWRVHSESDTWKHPQAFVEERERWIRKQISEDLSFEKEYAAAIRLLNNRNRRERTVQHIINNRRTLAIRTIMKNDFTHWRTWALLLLSLIPYSEVALTYLYKRKYELR